MFENRQDTTIFKDALISVSRHFEATKISNGKWDEKAINEAVKLVLSTVSSFTSSHYEVKTPLELLEKQITFNRRCHAVVFINLLNSQNFQSRKAITYYQSVLQELTFLDWHFYLKLNYCCHWSEFFIESAQQLEPYILTVLLKKFLTVPCEKELTYYLWHMVLQTYIWKSFIICSPSLFKAEEVCSFQFDFATTEHLSHDNEIQEYIIKNKKVGYLLLVYKNLLKNISEELEKNLDISLINVIFHGFKLLFKLINTITGTEGPDMEIFKNLTPLFEQCLTQETAKAAIVKSLDEDKKSPIDFSFQMISWDINEIYLIFVLCNLWKDFENIFNRHECKTIPVSILDYRKEFLSQMKKRNLSYITLQEIIETHLEDSTDFKSKYSSMMLNILEYHYPYASRADEYLLRNPDVCGENLFKLQEQHLSHLNPFEIHKVFADMIGNVKSNIQCVQFLKIYHEILLRGSPEIYNDAIKYISNKWGDFEKFALHSFDFKVTEYERKTLSLKEAEECLLPLFVQCPKKVLHSLISQAMMQGPSGMEMIKVLKWVPNVCLDESQRKCPLLDEICPYFERPLKAHEAKNFLLLIKSLMELEVTEDILPFDLFLESCILPNLSIEDENKLEYTLECLSVALDVLINGQALEINPENFVNLVTHLGKIMHFCVENSMVKVKETLIATFKSIAKYKRRPKLEEILKIDGYQGKLNFGDQHDIVVLYIIHVFFEALGKEQNKEPELQKWVKEVTTKKLELLLIWCVIRNDKQLFEENIKHFQKLTYISLLNILMPLFSHFTKLEWQNSINMLKICILQTEDRPTCPWILIDESPYLAHYLTIRCMMDCVVIIVQENPTYDIQYLCSCFTNTVQVICSNMQQSNLPLNKPMSTEDHVFSDYKTALILVNVFLDTCHLTSLLDSGLFYIFTPFLMHISKTLLSMEGCEEIGIDTFTNFMELGLDQLPDSKEKESLKASIHQV